MSPEVLREAMCFVALSYCSWVKVWALVAAVMRAAIVSLLGHQWPRTQCFL